MTERLPPAASVDELVAWLRQRWAKRGYIETGDGREWFGVELEAMGERFLGTSPTVMIDALMKAIELGDLEDPDDFS
jgi:hypothetical protein